ncbi:hypothetical protein CLV49_0379 [Labedella gwakjiensis]|uniref:Uncharacterized protein n=1 Tax=Labedella gwakjiensis TaxID=390269 RepID=A0A2P8GS46_9MICO|nr:vitamin K epoxide reductase family protein [Labedella gwakjiensis]PSL36781.1 hypothetical protein CLV49_0379 [Labedella gwakjiensis]RUQ84291.1 hypothetical protein ELQ93_15875 [Labedella gwakjiensis]
MTSNTPDHEASDHNETTPHGEAGVPVEPVQPVSAQDVYDGDETPSSAAPGGERLHPDAVNDPADGVRTDAAAAEAADVGAEEREPYPIGATDAEPAPVTSSSSGDEIVVDYGSAQEPDPADEPPLTKPSPADEQHPYPPQALGEPAPATATAATGAGVAGVAAAGAATDRDRDNASERTDRDADASSRPVYVQAPTPPKAKGNRGFGILIGLLATVVFAGLYLLALVFVVTPFMTPASDAAPDTALMSTLASAVFYVPVIVFFLAWALLVVILTRASWWGYVIGGFFVGLLTYAGYLAGLLAANAFEVAPSQVPQFLLDHLFDAPALLAFVIAREVPIWFGVWVGKRGRAVRVRNAEARDEYERLLEAGPSARV